MGRRLRREELVAIQLLGQKRVPKRQPWRHARAGRPESFDWSFQPGVDCKRLETIATCAYVREHEPVLFQGPPGVGKPDRAVALGVKAVKRGFSVSFHQLDHLLHLLKREADIPPRRLKAKKYMNAALLIIDEVAFQQLSRQEAALFFRLVSCRYQERSTIITTNKSVKD